MTGPPAEALLDAEGMRATAEPMLAPDAEFPVRDALKELILLYRGNLELLIPAVEKSAFSLPRGHDARFYALHGAGEARRKLDHAPGRDVPRLAAHAERLARSVVCLLNHLTYLEEARP
ncbi:DUF6415 family natural product biosynthesis protein [Streptomyces sp. PR69]|uniref:DUF6415 family natural product biosynthesis protein n=1 Tax=Streptomyces sp. PR69 TaxID=2984950 RepID=UPI0022649923|nr:DUF6415 family natural product biosynthesis protein [Streptomyces sp. PR69]